MMQDTTRRCAGRAEELLLKLDGELELAAVERLERHVAECPVCQQLMASLQTLDAALASRFAAPALADSFDRSVLARLDARPQRDRQPSADMQAQAERERTAALAGLRTSARRGLSAGLLDLAGLGAILWAGGRLAPRLLDFVGQHSAALPIVGYAGTAVAVAALSIAAAYLVAQVQRFAVAA